MTFLTVKDLKQTRNLWRQLHDERELVITRDGKPCAIMVEVDSASCEASLTEIRRAMFSAAISRIRRRTAACPVTPEAVDEAIGESRRSRGLK